MRQLPLQDHPEYFCKCRLFCPACQQNRVLLFAEWLDSHILEPVARAQSVVSK
jgi:hypothetical protein